MLQWRGCEKIMETNPYKSPIEQTMLAVENLEPMDLRERFRNEEMTVLAVGWFYYFFGSLLATIGLACVAGSVLRSGPSLPPRGEESLLDIRPYGLLPAAPK